MHGGDQDTGCRRCGCINTVSNAAACAPWWCENPKAEKGKRYFLLATFPILTPYRSPVQALTMRMTPSPCVTKRFAKMKGFAKNANVCG